MLLSKNMKKILISTLILWQWLTGSVHAKSYDAKAAERGLTLRYAFGFSTSFFLFSPSKEFADKAIENQVDLPSLIKLEPNIRFHHNFGVTYKGFTLAGSMPAPQNREKNITQGESEATSYTLNFKSRHTMITAFYHNIRGFFQIEPIDTREVEGLQIYPQFPDMSLNKMGVDMLIKINSEALSLGALYDQSEIQTKSGGSVLLRLTANQFSVDNKDDPILPPAFHEYFPKSSQITRIAGHELSGGIGYGHTFVLNKALYLSGAVTYGLSGVQGQFSSVNGEVEDFSSVNISSFYLLLGAGYNEKSFFMGFTLIADKLEATLEELSLTNPKNLLEVYLGKRF